MNILVIGPGALGIVAAMRLHEAGHDVEMAVRTASKARRLNDNGLTMTAPNGTVRRAQIRCVNQPRKAGTYELILLTTKCQVAAKVLQKWLPTLASDGWVVPFQNGVIGDQLRAVAGDRFLEGSIYWPATLVAEGHSQHRGEGHNVIGPWPDAEPTEEHQRIASVLEAVGPTSASGQMRGVKWSKLAINAAMTSCGVVTGTTLGQMVKHKPSTQAFLGVIRETVAVMKAAGIPVVRVGASKPDLLAKLPEPAARLVLRALAKRYASARSSSAQSLSRGEPTEVDYLNGLVASEGKRLGVPTPINDAVVATVHAIEAGRVRPGFAALEDMMRGAAA